MPPSVLEYKGTPAAEALCKIVLKRIISRTLTGFQVTPSASMRRCAIYVHPRSRPKACQGKRKFPATV